MMQLDMFDVYFLVCRRRKVRIKGRDRWQVTYYVQKGGKGRDYPVIEGPFPVRELAMRKLRELANEKNKR